MELMGFDLAKLERELTLLQYELVKPDAEKLLERGYTPVRVAALMFRYGFVFGRKLLKDSQKERRRQRMENQSKAEEQEIESQTSGDNEGSI